MLNCLEENTEREKYGNMDTSIDIYIYVYIYIYVQESKVYIYFQTSNRRVARQATTICRSNSGSGLQGARGVNSLKPVTQAC